MTPCSPSKFDRRFWGTWLYLLNPEDGGKMFYRNVGPSFNGLHGVTSRNTELFKTIAVRNSNPTINKEIIKNSDKKEESGYLTRRLRQKEKHLHPSRLKMTNATCPRRWFTERCCALHITAGSAACGTSHEEPYTSKLLRKSTALRPVLWLHPAVPAG
jgi:hypothetical protein